MRANASKRTTSVSSYESNTVCIMLCVFQEHVQTIHLRRFPLRCGVCGDGFSRRRALEAHRQEAHRPGARKRSVWALSLLR